MALESCGIQIVESLSSFQLSSDLSSSERVRRVRCADRLVESEQIYNAIFISVVKHGRTVEIFSWTYTTRRDNLVHRTFVSVRTYDSVRCISFDESLRRLGEQYVRRTVSERVQPSRLGRNYKQLKNMERVLTGVEKKREIR